VTSNHVQETCKGHPSAFVLAVLWRTTTSAEVGVFLFVCADTSNPLGMLLHLLRSPSRAVQERGEAVLQQNYHMRPPGALKVMRQADAVSTTCAADRCPTCS
jgi:hypothetical protein